MAGSGPSFQLRVDGHIAEESIPFSELSSRLTSYGVSNDITVNSLMSGNRLIVHGKALVLSKGSPVSAHPVFTLQVDGRVAVKDVTEAEMTKLLSDYGVRREETSRALLAGQSQRVLGQMLKLDKSSPEAHASLTAQSEQVTEPPALEGLSKQPGLPAQTPYDASLQELMTRAKKLRKIALIYGSLALGLTAVGGVFYALSVFAEPATSIAHILVPDSLSSEFPSSENGGGGISGLADVETAISDIFESTLFKVISAATFVVGAVASVLQGRIFLIVPAGAVGMMPFVIGGILNGGNLLKSPSSEFSNALESRNLDQLEHLLISGQDSDITAISYVLAQVAVANGSPSKWIMQTAHDLQNLESKVTFTVPADTAYAIQAAAFGDDSESLSDHSKAYRQNALAESGEWNRNSVMALVLAGLFTMLATVHESIAQIIFRRVRRIGDLLLSLR